MSDSAEYDRLVSDMRSAESQARSVSYTRASLQEKVDRLKEAKRGLSDYHDTFSDIHKAVKSDIQGSYSWQGRKFDDFGGYGSDLIQANKAYRNRIDVARDAINSEIARLENEIYRQDRILGELYALINSIAHKIANYFN